MAPAGGGSDAIVYLAFEDYPFWGPYTGDSFSFDHVALLHELGHVYDFTVLNDTDRAAFQRLARDYRPWWQHPNAPGEKFAQAYMYCALYGAALPRRATRQVQYDWNPTRRQHAAACRLINHP